MIGIKFDLGASIKEEEGVSKKSTRGRVSGGSRPGYVDQNK